MIEVNCYRNIQIFKQAYLMHLNSDPRFYYFTYIHWFIYFFFFLLLCANVCEFIINMLKRRTRVLTVCVCKYIYLWNKLLKGGVAWEWMCTRCIHWVCSNTISRAETEYKTHSAFFSLLWVIDSLLCSFLWYFACEFFFQITKCGF